MTSPADCTLSGSPPYNAEGCDLSGHSFTGVDLTDANLRHANLTGAIFAGTLGLAGADLTGATMGDGTDFTGCDLSATIFGPHPDFGTNPAALTKFVGATVGYASLGSTWRCLDLTGTVIAGLPSDITWLAVSECLLPGMDLSGLTLKNAHFSGVDLHNAIFTSAHLNNVVFGSSGVTVCDLSGASFAGAELAAAVFDTSTLTDADLSESTLTGASFLQCRMDGTRFDGTDVTSCTFSSPPRFASSAADRTSFRGARINYPTLAKQWSYLDLTDATLVGLSAGADLTYLQAVGADLTRMDLGGYTLDRCNLSGAILSGVRFAGASMVEASLNGVRSNCARIRIPNTDADYASLLAALTATDSPDVVETLARHGLALPDTVTVHTDAPGHWWTLTDPTTTTRYPVTADATSIPPSLVVMDPELITTFHKAQLPGANFSPAAGTPCTLRGADFSGAVLDGSDLSQADISQVNPYDSLTAATFAGASMNGAGLSRADLTGATLTGTVYLHGADLSMTKLADADLTGAQLGALAQLFRVSATSADFQPFLTALESDNAAGVASVFAGRGHPISNGQTNIVTVVAHRSWTITDASTQRSYTALRWTSRDTSTFLLVSTPTPAATLTGAYLPGATLVDANLYGVSAAHIQLYGTEVQLDGAILDNATLANANLGSSSIIVKQLYNVDLSDANLVNATLKGADLSNGVTLSYANLQGTVFTGASMNTANLANAAVAVGLDEATAGVFLFALLPTDPDYPAVLAELTAAVNQVNLTPGQPPAVIKRYTDALTSGDLAAVRPLFTANAISFSTQATITATDDATAWQIIDPGPTGDYTIWRGFDALGEDGLQTRPSLPTLRQVFARFAAVAGKLRWQATVSAGAASSQWLVDNDSENPKNLQLGYARWFGTLDSAKSLNFYGTELRIEQLGADDQLQIRTMTYGPTVLCPVKDGAQQCDPDGSSSVFGAATICPNGRTLSQNQNSVPPVSWQQMLRAGPPPAPPDCVPSPYGDCPQTSAAMLAQAEPPRRRLIPLVAAPPEHLPRSHPPDNC